MLDESFEVKSIEDNDLNRPHIEIYNGLMNSLLFDGYEKLLLIYLLANSNAKINAINAATISIKKLNEITKISKPTIYNRIKGLEEKGVLMKKNNVSTDNGNTANTYKVLNYTSVWDCKTLEELREETNKIKRKVLAND